MDSEERISGLAGTRFSTVGDRVRKPVLVENHAVPRGQGGQRYGGKPGQMRMQFSTVVLFPPEAIRTGDHRKPQARCGLARRRHEAAPRMRRTHFHRTGGNPGICAPRLFGNTQSGTFLAIIKFMQPINRMGLIRSLWESTGQPAGRGGHAHPLWKRADFPNTDRKTWENILTRTETIHE